MKFHTQYDPVTDSEFTVEKGGGERITDSAGYVPAKIRIEQMIQAGRNLVDFRRGENYDINEGDSEEDVVMDPTRVRGFDMADASRLQREIASRGTKKEREKNEGKEKVDEPPKKDESKETPGSNKE